MVEYYRGKRENWLVDEKAGKVKATRAVKGPKETGTLDDLKDLIL